MRLTQEEQTIIVNTFLKYFKSGDIYLFGSRIDENKKGGDIDLYIDIQDDNIYDKKIKFITILKTLLEDQKIDVVISKDKNRDIEKQALKNGVNLMDIEKLKITKYINECEKHKIRINEAYNEIQPILPISAKKYKELNSNEIKNIDQYLFRFAKMQDTIGEKLFKAIINEYVQSSETLTFVDILNQLEQIGILSSADDWKILRTARNNIAHQYDDEPEEMADAINKIFAQKDILFDVFENIKDNFDKKGV